MPSLKFFSLFESGFSVSNFNTCPFSAFIEEIRIEINYEKPNYVISADKEFRINNKICNSSQIKNNDLIYCNNEFILFCEENKICMPESLFIGKIRIKNSNEKMLVCQLPRKSSGRSFAEIHKIIKNYPAEKKIYIDCSAIRFMDSESVSCMVDMIRQMKSEGRSLYFYKPGERFITYIELANIRKMVSLITSGNELLDRYIKQKQSGSNSHCQNRYIITDNINNYVIKPEMIISVGRLDNTCDIILQDEQVSRIHALLLNTGNALYAVDCGSTNLTYINGWKSEPYCLNSLKVNDSIVFGNKSYFRIRQI